MPYYEFQCSKCKKNFTVKESFAEHDQHKPVKCPKCGSRSVDQLVTTVGVKTSKKS